MILVKKLTVSKYTPVKASGLEEMKFFGIRMKLDNEKDHPDQLRCVGMVSLYSLPSNYCLISLIVDRLSPCLISTI
jgi:hypothetical protein